SKRSSVSSANAERFHSLDQSRFWRLSSGKVIEETLYRASLGPGASTGSKSTRSNLNIALHTLDMLYAKESTPFVVNDLSESWWALLFNLVDDIPGIFMIDGENVASTRVT
ncbi:hypothetical protein BGZ65_006624, partial [Modicella reniformis]